MKLLYCNKCDDIVRLHRDERTCECGETGGVYLNDWEVKVYGDYTPFAIHNGSFQRAMRYRTTEWPGNRFIAFVIPHNAPKIHEADNGTKCTSETDEAEEVRGIRDRRERTKEERPDAS